MNVFLYLVLFVPPWPVIINWQCTQLRANGTHKNPNSEMDDVQIERAREREKEKWKCANDYDSPSSNLHPSCCRFIRPFVRYLDSVRRAFPSDTSISFATAVAHTFHSRMTKHIFFLFLFFSLRHANEINK